MSKKGTKRSLDECLNWLSMFDASVPSVTSLERTFCLSRWLEFNFKKTQPVYSVLHSYEDLLVQAYDAIQLVTETDLSVTDISQRLVMASSYTSNIAQAKRPTKTQCLARCRNKLRCTLLTTCENGLCSKHKDAEPVAWTSTSSAEPSATLYTLTITQDTFQEDLGVVFDSLTISSTTPNVSTNDAVKPPVKAKETRELRVLLKKDRQGNIFWPGTDYLVKSFKEPYVVGRKVTDETFVALTSYDKTYLRQYNIPFKVVSMQFNGNTKVPEDILASELRSLLLDDYKEEYDDEDD